MRSTMRSAAVARLLYAAETQLHMLQVKSPLALDLMRQVAEVCRTLSSAQTLLCAEVDEQLRQGKPVESDEVTRLRAGIKRLGSMEAFTSAGVLLHDDPASQELLARIEHARALMGTHGDPVDGTRPLEADPDLVSPADREAQIDRRERDRDRSR